MGDLYRLRSPDKLFSNQDLYGDSKKCNEPDGKNELRALTMYAATSDQLNDPMENHKNLYWMGDEIAWNNLLKNYLFFLEQVFYDFVWFPDAITKTDFLNLLYKNRRDEPPEYQEILQQVYKVFFENPLMHELPSRLAKRGKIERDELNIHLTVLHAFAVQAIQSVYLHKKIILSPIWRNIPAYKLCSKMDDCYFSSFDLVDHKVLNQKSQSITLNRRIQQKECINDFFVTVDFPGSFIRGLEKLLYCDQGIICFMSDFRNSALWGQYADSHKGACLIYKIDSELPRMGIHHRTGYKASRKNAISKVFGRSDFRIQEVSYSSDWPEINFFDSLGKIPAPIVSSWLVSDERIHSDIFSKIRSNEDEWIRKLWSNIEKINTTKSKDWEIEKESRLIIPLGMSCGRYDAEDKIVKYDFNQLTGVIFGINMIESHKEKIISIVKDHCKNHERMSFDFFQAYFCKRNNCVEKIRLDIDMTF